MEVTEEMVMVEEVSFFVVEVKEEMKIEESVEEKPEETAPEPKLELKLETNESISLKGPTAIQTVVAGWKPDSLINGRGGGMVRSCRSYSLLMAADVVVAPESAKSCCAVLKERYSKLEEKRNALRQAVKLLEHEIDKFQTKNLNLKKSYEEEKARADTEREEKLKEAAVRVVLENEISNLKSEIASLQKTGGSRDLYEGEEVTLLQNRVSEGKAEINRMKELLQKERQRGDSERKKAEAEKKKAAEAWEIVEAEKSKAKEEKRLANIERERAEEIVFRLESLKTEANQARLKFISEISKHEEANRRLEAEKKKASREKKFADSEMTKAEEQRKCAEANRKKTVDEKSCADNLSQQLEEERRRNAALQKEINEIVSARKMDNSHPVPSDNNITAETAEVKLLKKELKLEKMQVKHAKRVVKLEKVRNNLLQQEICRVKQECIQFLHRLDILEGCFSRSIEGTGDLAKTDNFLKLKSLNLKRKLSGIEPCDLYSQSENEVIKACYTAIDGLDHFRPTLECTGPLIPISGWSCTEPISGISSDLESLLGGSVRNKSQNSATYSTTTSFSDRQLVGSQGRGAFSVTTSAKAAEENSKQGPAIPRLSGEVTKMRYNENLGVVAENSVIGPVHRKAKGPCLASNGHDSIIAVGRVPEHSRKRKRIRDSVESIARLYSEDKKLHLQMEEKLSALHGVLNLNNSMPAAILSQRDGNSIALEEGRCMVSRSQNDLNAKHYRSSKKRKTTQKQKLNLQQGGNSEEQKQADKLEAKGREDANVCIRAGPPADHLIGTVAACRENKVDSVRSNQENMVCFEDMASGDYMKLLDLDNAVDEQHYRIAMEVPLSPTLPEIEFPSLDACEIDSSKYLVEESFYRGLLNEKDILLPSFSFDVIDVEIDSNRLFFNIGGTMDGPLFHKIGGPVQSFDELENSENGSRNATNVGKTCGPKIWDAVAEMDVAEQIPVSGNEGTQVPCASNFIATHENTLKYCVVFSDTKDSSSISRIFCATRTCITESCMLSQTDWVVQKILRALAMEKDLLPEEKACVFFSLLLQNFSVVISVNFRNFLTGDSILCSDSFAAHIKSVICDVETRYIFVELCQLDVLLRVIEDFLINRRIMVYNDVQCNPLIRCNARRSIFLLGGVTVFMSSETATIDQVVAGSIILASICAAVDHIGFICEASYNMLQMHRSNSSLMLKVLHVFANICGKKYFTLSNYGLIMTTVKSVVSLLERGNESVVPISSSCLTSVSGNGPEFPPCAKCPFSDSPVSADKVIWLLLEKLQSYVVSGLKHQHLMEIMESVTSSKSNYRVLLHMEGEERSPEHDEVLRVLDVDCDASCFLYKHGRLGTLQSHSVADWNLCHFSDILSLVELIACNKVCA
ncbi:hypothetical protein HHK36_001417 [Tetracentron sinense]|uniref:Maternal effect embryo arrest 22 n=1 Tax=Tetracentron sinense TaxID=13715 RepID=A0A835DUR5_TETSI|nr:hypothetical protein HHK36_001417 [Tetracentron sinense]